MSKRGNFKNEHTINENHKIDIDMGQSPLWFARLSHAFGAFKDRNYRLYFTGQFISLIGTWIQMVAQGWLVLEITHSALWVGVISALGSLPILIFVLFGGVIVDRFSPKKILYLTNILPLILALILGLLTVFDVITLFEIGVLAFLLGVVNALDVPARHTFIAKIMQKPYLASAIALNSATFNGARIIGPALAGILIGLIGIGGTFVINAASFLAVIASLRFIHLKERSESQHHSHPLLAIKEGLSYAFSRKDLRLLMIVTSMISIFGWAPLSILPVVTVQVFHQEAAGLGYLHTATGLGAVVASGLVSIFTKARGVNIFIIGGNLLLGSSLLLFSLVGNFPLGLLLMFFTGLALIAEMSVINSVIQHTITDSIRGRVMSIYALMFRGMAPFGSFAMGWLAEYLGSQGAIRLGALIVFIVGFTLYLKRKHIPQTKLS